MALLDLLQTRPRIALYSHDTMGLGHIRRNQLIAMALAAPPLDASVLLISGVREGGGFPLPPGVDSVILPAYRKQSDGGYASRSLSVDVEDLTDFRAALIDKALERFQPDLFIADNVPGGALDELLPALERMRAEGQAHRVLGLRDILDEASVVEREWIKRDNFRKIADYYDEVWIYGDPRVFATADVYAFPEEVRACTAYTGYLDPFRHSATRLPAHRPCPGEEGELVICAVGGGEDGFALACNFASAALPDGMRAMIVAGPLMPDENARNLRSIIAGRCDIELVEGVCDLVPLLARAGRVVTMAGYNTANEVVRSGLPVLLVPRSRPRAEQVIRSLRLDELGLATHLSDHELSPAAIADWLARPARRRRKRLAMDFGGLDAIVARANRLFSRGNASPQAPRRTRPRLRLVSSAAAPV